MGYNLLINGIYWGYNPLILTIDPNFLGHPSKSKDGRLSRWKKPSYQGQQPSKEREWPPDGVESPGSALVFWDAVI